MKDILKMLLIMALLAGMAVAAPSAPQVYSDQFLICLQPDLVGLEMSTRGTRAVTGLASLDLLFADEGVVGVEPWLPGATPDDVDGDIYLMNIYRVRLDAARANVQEKISQFHENEFVLYAETEPINRIAYEPNDPRWSSLWYLEKIEADVAWDLWDIAGGEEPGSRSIVLASIDTGVMYTHPDLEANAWVNQAEIPSSIFDDVDADDDGVVTAVEVLAYLSDYNSSGTVNLQDALHASSPFMDGVDGDDWDSNPNSYVDDLFGWDISGVTSGTDPDNDPMAATSGAWVGYRSHGTNVAGNLAAITDNEVGIASATFNGLVMSVKCMYDQDNNAYVSGGYPGMLYAAKAGADIINSSWGSHNSYNASQQSTCNVIYSTYGSLIVASSGNGNDDGTPNNYTHYPSGYDNVVSVTAVDQGDDFDWATYGSTVDLSAPGENIWVTTFTNTFSPSYESTQGTSFSSPITASAFGLLKSFFPDATNDWLVETMLAGADNIDDINPDFAGGLGAGRVNVHSAIALNIYPELTFDSYSLQMVDDNGDGQLSPGEEAKLRVNVYNDPAWSNALSVQGLLSSSSEYVTISDAEADYGDINAGNVGVQILDRYQFSVSDGAPSGNIPFELQITANADGDYPYTTTLSFEVEVSIWQASFPFELTNGVVGGNAVVDLDGDGSKEIIFGGEDSLVHAVQTSSLELPGFPVEFGAGIHASPAIGDIDNDGDLEIVIGSLDYNLYVIQHDGSVESIYTSDRYIYAEASLAELDGDPELEIIVPTWNFEVLGLNHDGTPISNFPVILEGERMTVGAAIADLDGDLSPEIVVPTWADSLHAFHLDGSEVDGFPVFMSDRARSAPAIGNIDNSVDGSLEIILGSDADDLVALAADGSLLWTYTGSIQNIQSSPALTDMDGDGDLEIVFGSLDRNIHAVDHEGESLEGWPIATEGAIYSSPAIGDVDGDGIAEIFIGSDNAGDDGALYGYHLDGTTLSGFPVVVGARVKGAPTLDDLDGDGDVEIAVGTDQSMAVVDFMTAGDVTAIPGWRTARGNLERTGLYEGTLVSTRPGLNLPRDLRLHAAYPNPFNPQTRISYELPSAGDVRLDVVDLRGRHIRTLVSENQGAGVHAVNWAGRDDDGLEVAAGVYLYRLYMGSDIQVKKLTYLK